MKRRRHFFLKKKTNYTMLFLESHHHSHVSSRLSSLWGMQTNLNQELERQCAVQVNRSEICAPGVHPLYRKAFSANGFFCWTAEKKVCMSTCKQNGPAWNLKMILTQHFAH